MKVTVAQLVANVDRRAKVPRHFDLWSMKLQIVWLKQHQRKEKAK